MYKLNIGASKKGGAKTTPPSEVLPCGFFFIHPADDSKVPMN
jgi:hypothetical protein